MITIPTLSTLYTTIISDIESKYGASIPTVGRSFLRAWAATQAGVAYLNYLALGKVQKNIFVDTCDVDTLTRFGRVKIGRNPYPATAGEYILNVTGEIGAVIPASSTFKSDDSSANPGFLFVLDSEFTFLTTSETITVRSLTAGLDSELEVSDTLTPTAPISLVDSGASSLSVSSITVTPVSEESTDDYRRKILDAFRLEPQGGAGSDYRLWAADVQEVEQSYPFANLTFQEVDLHIESTLADSVDGKGTPTSETLLSVKESIEEPTVDRPSRKPLLDVVNYLPVVIKEISIEIEDFDSVTVDQESAIFSAIETYLSTVRPFVSSIDVLADKNDSFGNYNVISIILGLYPGSSFGTVTMTVDGIGYSSYEFEAGNIPHLDDINYL